MKNRTRLRVVDDDIVHPRDLARNAVRGYRRRDESQPWCEVPNGRYLDVDAVLRRSEPNHVTASEAQEQEQAG